MVCFPNFKFFLVIFNQLKKYILSVLEYTPSTPQNKIVEIIEKNEMKENKLYLNHEALLTFTALQDSKGSLSFGDRDEVRFLYVVHVQSWQGKFPSKYGVDETNNSTTFGQQVIMYFILD